MNSVSHASGLRTEHIPDTRLTKNKSGQKPGEHNGEHPANTPSGVHPNPMPTRDFNVALLTLLFAAVCLCLPQRLPAEPPKTLDPIIVVPDTPIVDRSNSARISEDIPTNPGFIAPILIQNRPQQPFGIPANSSQDTFRVAEIVAHGLATKGLKETFVDALVALGPSEFAAMQLDQQQEALAQVGLPLDWIAQFKHITAFPFPAPINIGFTAGLLKETKGTPGVVAFLNHYQFACQPTNPRFQIATESGENDIGLLRLQLTRGDDWLGHADGGAIDIARQLVTQIPEAEFLAGIRKDHLTAFLATAKDWPAPAEDFTLIAENFPLAQWAQDNGKAGVLLDENGRPVSAATLAPRYASRRDEASVFIPGESFAMDGLQAGGHPVFHSPLIFQGGNLMAVRDPKTQKRILLIGEAEILRNINLGLSREQVLEAFQVECAVDECRIIPSVSFHLDFDLTVRAVAGQLVAFVQDTDAGAKIVLAAGINALSTSKYMKAAAASAALSALKSNDRGKLLAALGPVMAANVDPAGHFAESFARAFSTSPVDSHVGNLRLFLVAMDTFVHPVAKTSNTGTQAYLDSFDRLESDRRELHALLESWGWKVVPVPCLGEGRRTINPLNGIHDRRRYFMPVIGGLYSEMDTAATAIFNRELGPDVQIVPIRCAESQRRAGSLHCAVAAYPKIENKGNDTNKNND